MKELGGWNDDWQFNRKDKKTRDWIRIARYAIYGGFAIVAIVVLLVFIPRAGLSVEIFETGETLSTISVKINNNNLHEIHNITLVFDDDYKKKQVFNSIAPFSAIFVTPDKDNLNFKKIIVTADNGKLQTIKYR